MSVLDKILVLSEFAGFIICLVLFFYALMRRQYPAARASAAMMAATCFLLVTNTIGWLSASDTQVQEWWMKLGYLGVATLPVAWFFFALVLGGYERWITRWRVALLLIVPALIFALAMSGAMFTEIRYVMFNGSMEREVVFSNWIWLSVVNSYSLLFTGMVLIVRALARATYLRRYQVAALVLATVVPLLSNGLYLLHLQPFPNDLSPLTLAFSGIVLSVGVLRYQVIDLAPVARSAVADHTRDAILVVDVAGRIADLNPVACQILGRKLPAAFGLPLTDLLPALSGVLMHDSPSRCEFSLTVAGQSMDLEADVTPLFIQRTYPAGRLIVLHDITARKQNETSLHAALQHERELAEIKARFYAYFAHQLRTPLSVILSSSELLENYGRDWPDDRRHTHFERINQAVGHLTDLSERVSTFEKNEQHNQDGEPPLQLESFDPQEFVLQLTQQAQWADANRHPIYFELNGPVQPAHQDAAMLRDVVDNVLSNALKFSPLGSPVRVTLTTLSPHLSIRVVDLGCGIPADELPRVLQPFYRASNAHTVSGTGLGLAIASRTIARLGGSLQIESQINEGTQVLITAPLELPA